VTSQTPKTRPFSIYLLKKSIKNGQSAIEQPGKLTKRAVKLGAVSGQLFIKPAVIRPPGWLELFRGITDLAGIALKTASSSAVLTLKVGGRVFAVVFGYGRHLLQPGCWDESFGLRTTLNSIAPDSIRSLDRKSFDALTRHTREEASREGPIEDFGLNIEQDLLRAVVGRPVAPELGRRIAGMDALTATVAMSLLDLPVQLERYLNQWRKTGYRSRFPWVDQVSEVRDGRMRAELDAELCANLTTGTTAKCWLAVPSSLDWSDVGGFRYSTAKGADLYPDVHLREFLGSLRDPAKLSPEQLRRRTIACFDADGQFPRHRWTVYQCLYAELRRQGQVFLLTGGQWYRVTPTFVKKIDDYIAGIPATKVKLPNYSHTDEGAYNRDVQAGDPSGIALMDRRIVTYPARPSGVEFCDLFTRSRAMVHVKRYHGSAVLSHLFGQGVVAATLLAQDADFRRALNSLLPKAYRLADCDRRPATNTYEVAFCIVSRSKAALELPFFSKVNLRHAAQALAGLGYKVTLTKIQGL